MNRQINDCWLDPDGHVYEVPPFGHNDFAEQYLHDEFPIEDFRSWCENPEFRTSYEETLNQRGWVRYSTTIHRWVCECCPDYEDYYPRPNRTQRDVMYELTGYNYDEDHNC
jgi:hypothetical protein